MMGAKTDRSARQHRKKWLYLRLQIARTTTTRQPIEASPTCSELKEAATLTFDISRDDVFASEKAQKYEEVMCFLCSPMKDDSRLPEKESEALRCLYSANDRRKVAY